MQWDESTLYPRQALEAIDLVRSRVIEGRVFKGFSGAARITGGIVAFVAAWLMSFPWVPKEFMLLGWSLVGISGLALNYGALAWWYCNLPSQQRTWIRLKPAIDSLPPLFVALLLTILFLQLQMTDYLFGLWMLCFALVHFACRHTQPAKMYEVGIFYLLSGTWVLLVQTPNFSDPWPMGIIFGIGETIGGLIALRARTHE